MNSCGLGFNRPDVLIPWRIFVVTPEIGKEHAVFRGFIIRAT